MMYVRLIVVYSLALLILASLTGCYETVSDRKLKERVERLEKTPKDQDRVPGAGRDRVLDQERALECNSPGITERCR